ncbi:hypothetical protein Trydic_g5426 [Trypoxylus dichotomus]
MTDCLNQLPTLNNLHIPRKVTTFNEFVELQLHGFSDASEKAYGACIYVRATNATGEHVTQLLCSKSRVSQLKRQSLPRLELCASLLLLQLYYKVKQSLCGMISKSVLWTDSTLVINWISSDPNRWKTFIGNRVSEIQSLTEVEQCITSGQRIILHISYLEDCFQSKFSTMNNDLMVQIG